MSTTLSNVASLPIIVAPSRYEELVSKVLPRYLTNLPSEVITSLLASLGCLPIVLAEWPISNISSIYVPYIVPSLEILEKYHTYSPSIVELFNTCRSRGISHIYNLATNTVESTCLGKPFILHVSLRDLVEKLPMPENLERLLTIARIYPTDVKSFVVYNTVLPCLPYAEINSELVPIYLKIEEFIPYASYGRVIPLIEEDYFYFLAPVRPFILKYVNPRRIDELYSRVERWLLNQLSNELIRVVELNKLNDIARRLAILNQLKNPVTFHIGLNELKLEKTHISGDKSKIFTISLIARGRPLWENPELELAYICRDRVLIPLIFTPTTSTVQNIINLFHDLYRKELRNVIELEQFLNMFNDLLNQTGRTSLTINYNKERVSGAPERDKITLTYSFPQNTASYRLDLPEEEKKNLIQKLAEIYGQNSIETENNTIKIRKLTNITDNLKLILISFENLRRISTRDIIKLIRENKNNIVKIY